MSCHKYGGLDHFNKEFPLWETEKGKGNSKEKGKEQRSFSKTDMRKAMVAAWGESDSDEDQEQPEEDTTHLYLMAKDDDFEELPRLKVCVHSFEEQLEELSKS